VTLACHTTHHRDDDHSQARLSSLWACRVQRYECVCGGGGVILTALMLVQSGKSLYSIAQGARKLSEAVLPAIAAESLRSAGGTEAM
jgi:hypothetical protein